VGCRRTPREGAPFGEEVNTQNPGGKSFLWKGGKGGKRGPGSFLEQPQKSDGVDFENNTNKRRIWGGPEGERLRIPGEKIREEG